jgi:hypothetical protein
MRLVAMHRTLLCLSVFWTPSRCEVIEMSKEPVINSTGSAILISDCVDVNCFHKMSCALGETNLRFKAVDVDYSFPEHVQVDHIVGRKYRLV